MQKKHSISHLIATCFYLGYTPFFPGTTTSIVAMLALFFLPGIPIIANLILLNILFFVGVIVSEKITVISKIKDPSYVVIDEWFGMWIALFLLPQNIWLYLLALVLFRLFDIMKPTPIAQLEKIPGGLGIMLDDACAGIFAFVIVQIVVAFLL